MEYEEEYFTDDKWEKILRRDISMIGKKRQAVKVAKPVLSEGNASQVVKAEKKHAADIAEIQRILDKHIIFAKELLPTVSHLADMMRDAEMRLEADTIDDVYGLQDMKLEFKKLAASISKFIPKEEPKNELRATRSEQEATRIESTTINTATRLPPNTTLAPGYYIDPDSGAISYR